MTPDTLFLVCTAVLLAVFLLSAFCNPFFRSPRRESSEAEQADDSATFEWSSLSVVVLAHDEAEHLEEHLLAILEQTYAGTFDVVVVTEQGDIEAENVVKRHAADPRLHSTYIPSRSLFMSRRKLAASLGVKAARGEWVVLVDADCRPVSPFWLQTMARQCTEDVQLVVGYSNYPQEETPPRYRFARLRSACYALRAAQKGSAYRSTGTNVAFRKAPFIAQDGFRENLQYIYGEYDFIVSKLGRTGSAATVLSEEAMVEQAAPTRKMWREHCVGYESIRRALRGAAWHSLQYRADLLLMYLNWLLFIAAAVYAGLTARWLLLGVAALLFVLTLTVRLLLARKAIRLFGEHIALWRVLGYELSLGFRDLYYRLRYITSNKSDYTTHKL